MKKLIAVVAFCCLAAASAQAQGVFKKNDVLLNVGIGLGTAVDIGRTVVPPISFSGEYCILDNMFDANSSLGVGAFVGFAAGRVDYFNSGSVNFTQKINSVIIGARGAFHYQFVDKLDTYAGVMLGGNIANVRTIGYGVPRNYGGFLGDFFVGARYYFEPKIAVFGELGFGVSYFTIGASFKL